MKLIDSQKNKRGKTEGYQTSKRTITRTSNKEQCTCV
uniref:Uncharacterized protein n=1 Tax=Rhizophora mucronata TaxID=61149 RepID=A0A2P2R3S9_RHIMU